MPTARRHRTWTCDALQCPRGEQTAHVTVEIMRAFVRLREMLASNRDLSPRFDELEQPIRCAVQGCVRRHPPTDGASCPTDGETRLQKWKR